MFSPFITVGHAELVSASHCEHILAIPFLGEILKQVQDDFGRYLLFLFSFWGTPFNTSVLLIFLCKSTVFPSHDQICKPIRVFADAPFILVVINRGLKSPRLFNFTSFRRFIR